MVVYKMLNSKAEIDLAFFLTLILFSLVAIGKEFCITQNFSQPEWQKLWLWKISTVLSYFEKFECCIRDWLRAAVIWSYNKSAPRGVLYILGN